MACKHRTKKTNKKSTNNWILLHSETGKSSFSVKIVPKSLTGSNQTPQTLQSCMVCFVLIMKWWYGLKVNFKIFVSPYFVTKCARTAVIVSFSFTLHKFTESNYDGYYCYSGGLYSIGCPDVIRSVDGSSNPPFSKAGQLVQQWCIFHESMSIPWVLANNIGQCLNHESRHSDKRNKKI